MAFKMKGYQAHGKSPMKVGGKWSNWMADRQQFIGDEIEARRKKPTKVDDDKDKNNKTTTTTTTTKPTVSQQSETPVVETPVVETPVVEEKTTSGRVEHALSEDNPELNKYVVEEPITQDDKPEDSTEPTKKDDTEKPKPKTNKRLRSYKEAWDSDLHFTTSDDGKTKTAPKELGGASYPNTPEGYKAFVSASEEWWKKQHELKNKEKNLNIDSQTGKQSTHEVWKEE